MILWSSKGIEEFGRWVHGVVASFPVSFFLNPRLFTRGTEIVLAALVISLAFHGSRSLAEFRAEGRTQFLPSGPPCGSTILSRPKRIATWDAQVTWYAVAAFVQIPDSDPSTTLRYIDSQKADFIYIDRLYPRPAPTMEAWLSRGILDSHAKLIYETGRGDNRILIYRGWKARPANSPLMPPSKLTLERTILHPPVIVAAGPRPSRFTLFSRVILSSLVHRRRHSVSCAAVYFFAIERRFL